MSKKLIDLIMLRQSVRRYTDQKVEKEKLQRCLEAAQMAPSACNAQPWKFIVVDDEQLVKKVARETWDRIAAFNKFVDQAPVIIVITIEKSPLVPTMGRIIKKKEYPLIDIGIAAEHFCLQATEEGLGTCMLGWYNEKPIQKLLGIPKNRRIGLLISLGYEPDDYKNEKENLIGKTLKRWFPIINTRIVEDFWFSVSVFQCFSVSVLGKF